MRSVLPGYLLQVMSVTSGQIIFGHFRLGQVKSSRSGQVMSVSSGQVLSFSSCQGTSVRSGELSLIRSFGG